MHPFQGIPSQSISENVQEKKPIFFSPTICTFLINNIYDMLIKINLNLNSVYITYYTLVIYFIFIT